MFADYPEKMILENLNFNVKYRLDGHISPISAIYFLNEDILLSGDDLGNISTWSDYSIVKTVKISSPIITITSWLDKVVVQTRKGVFYFDSESSSFSKAFASAEIGFFKILAFNEFILLPIDLYNVQLYTLGGKNFEFSFSDIICHCACFLNDKSIFFGLDDGSIILRSLNGYELFKLNISTEPIFRIIYRDSILICCGPRSFILSLNEKYEVVTTTELLFSGLQISSSDSFFFDKLIVVASWDGSIYLFSFEAQLILIIQKHLDSVNLVHKISNSEFISGSKDLSLIWWSLNHD